MFLSPLSRGVARSAGVCCLCLKVFLAAIRRSASVVTPPIGRFPPEADKRRAFRLPSALRPLPLRLQSGLFPFVTLKPRAKAEAFQFSWTDPTEGELIFYTKQKAFKLREDIRVYADESMSEEVLSIQARQILDFSAAYDVTDPKTKRRIGVLRRKGFSSFLRDTWQVLDADEKEIGRIQEDSMGLALLRRYLLNILPQHFTLKVGEMVVADYRQQFNPFIYKLEMDFSKDTRGILDRRLGAAAGILLGAIEGRQD